MPGMGHSLSWPKIATGEVYQQVGNEMDVTREDRQEVQMTCGASAHQEKSTFSSSHTCVSPHRRDKMMDGR